MKSFTWLLTALSIGVFFYYEIDNPKALAILIAGLIARRQFIKWFDKISEPHEATSQWTRDHAKEWAAGRHDTWNPATCPQCKKRPV